MKFEDYGLSPELKTNLANLGFKRPTDIQFKAIPSIMKGEDVLAIAQTGTGKTAAFAIPIIQRLQNNKQKGITIPRCLVMVPTRELALQITEVFQLLGKKTGVQTFSLFGGVEQDPQIARLAQGVDIVVSTPGRMFDLQSQGKLNLKEVQILVLDEADHMLDLGFIDDIRDLTKRLPKQRQTLFFSATIDEKIKKLAYSLVKNPIRIQISPKNSVSKNVKHAVSFIGMDDKRFFLERIVEENPDRKILVFVRTKVRAERVLKAMERVDVVALNIHGGKEQKDRLNVMEQFKAGSVKMLIATDVSARGIDIPNVDMVVNYDLPDKPENYVHRVGRTGRGVLKGKAISFCSPEEKPLMYAIEKYLDQPLEILHIDRETYLETLDFTKDSGHYDFKTLIDEIEAVEKKKKKSK